MNASQRDGSMPAGIKLTTVIDFPNFHAEVITAGPHQWGPDQYISKPYFYYTVTESNHLHPWWATSVREGEEEARDTHIHRSLLDVCDSPYFSLYVWHDSGFPGNHDSGSSLWKTLSEGTDRYVDFGEYAPR